jgi:hypothetical protein
MLARGLTAAGKGPIVSCLGIVTDFSGLVISLILGVLSLVFGLIIFELGKVSSPLWVGTDGNATFGDTIGGVAPITVSALGFALCTFFLGGLGTVCSGTFAESLFVMARSCTAPIAVR